MPDYPHLRIETTPDGVRTITLDRADKLNAVNGALAAAFTAAMASAAGDDAVRVVVITGAGRAFCAGLDLSAPPELPSATRAERLDPYAWVGDWVRGVVACEKPVIAAVNGPAAGAGFGLALACDIRLVAQSAKLTAGYVRRGLSPDAGVSYFLPRHVGVARAADILMTGRDVDAAEAERIGLANKVVPRAELDKTLGEWSERLAKAPTRAIGFTKWLTNRSLETDRAGSFWDEAYAQELVSSTEDASEGMASFVERRPPEFKGW